MPLLSRTFYLFSAIHSFLLGLLPIFIPVILWNRGLDISNIAWFVALSGIGFLIALAVWDRLRASANWSMIIALSFVLQMMLVGLLILDAQWVLFSIGALINGAAGCFYWSTQRLLFQAITNHENSGNTFGNFQILVTIALKIGILIGSFLLDSDYTTALILLSFTGSVCGFLLLRRLLQQTQKLLNEQQPAAFSWSQIIAFKDQYRSKSIFLADGIFLFLESYFWVLTLYMLTKESLTTLGLLIVALSISLAVIFLLLKRMIDKTKVQVIYHFSVWGYALAWLLRGELNFQADPVMMYAFILLIAFLSSFFRLAFNKRFYDIASRDKPIYYIVCKSYYSQFAILVFFSLVAILASFGDDPLNQLQILYDLAIPLVFVYFLYRNKVPKDISENKREK